MMIAQDAPRSTSTPKGDLALAAALEILPVAVFLAAAVIVTSSSSEAGIGAMFDVLLVLFDPTELGDMGFARAIATIGILFAAIGPGLGRAYLGDWGGVIASMAVRAAMLGGAGVCMVLFIIMIFACWGGCSDGLGALLLFFLFAAGALALSTILVTIASAIALARRWSLA